MLQVIGSQVARGAGNIGLQPNVPSEPSELRTLDSEWDYAAESPFLPKMEDPGNPEIE